MSRFRPNIVVTGWPDPHTEDRVHRMLIGTTTIGFGELAIRCAVTTRRPGNRPPYRPEPLRNLADYRRESQGVSFGLKAAVLTPGHISTNDPSRSPNGVNLRVDPRLWDRGPAGHAPSCPVSGR